MDFLHTFVNIFAGGRSEIKVYLFLAYLAVIILIYLYHRAKESRESHKIRTLSQRVFVISVAVLFIMVLVAQIVLVNDTKAAFTDRLVVYNNSEVSSTGIYHIHIMKGAMALLLSPFIKSPISGVDIGIAFLGEYSIYFFFAAAIALILGIIASISLFWTHINLHGHKRRGFFFTIAYAIFSFSILKNTIDGGIFNIETIPALVSMYVLLAYEKKTKHICIFGCLTLVAIVLVAIEAVLLMNQLTVETPFSVPHLIGVCSLFVSLLYVQIENKKKLYNVLFSLLFVSGIYIAIERDMDNIRYAKSLISRGTMVMVYSAYPIDVPGLELRSQIFNLKFYRGNLLEDTQAQSIIDATKVPANFRPVAISGQTCGLFGEQNAISFDISIDGTEHEVIPQNIIAKQNTYFSVKNIEKYSDQTSRGLTRYKVAATLSKCLTRELDVIEAVFKEQGYKKFIVSRIRAAE